MFASIAVLIVIVGAMTGCGLKEELSTVSAKGEQAILYTDEGYSLHVSDKEWIMFAPGSWYAAEDEHVRFWVDNHAGLDKGQVERILIAQGYQADEGEL